jgi:uncharacterized protein (TIRG00374 family)
MRQPSPGDAIENPLKGYGATVSRLMSRKNLWRAVRVVISVALIGYLLATANLGELSLMLRSWHAVYFAIAVLIGVLRNVVFAMRWRVTLGVSDIQVPFPTLIKFYFVGSFFNLFLPTALGGDVVRGYDLAVYSGKRMGAATSVLVERIVGFFALALITLLALLVGSRVIEDTAVTTVIFIVCLGYFALAAVVFNAKIMKRLVAMLQFIRLWDIGKRLDRMVDSLHAFSMHRAILWQCFVLSMICQVLGILAAYSLAWAINLKLAPVYFFMVLPMIWIITMVPLSINGLGVREGAFVFFFTKVGVSDSAALLLSFLNFSQMIVLGLVGGIIYLLGQVSSPVAATRRQSER